MSTRELTRRARAWLRSRTFGGVLLAAALLLALPWLALAVAACFVPLPIALSDGRARSKVMVLDRDGRLLREVAVGEGAPETPVRVGELSPWVVPALLAAEDARFYRHPGVDPLAVTRALGQWAVARRIVSGASTLTQQLARTLEPRPRTIAGKLREMAQALRIERALSKEQIIEEYLSRVEFGPGLTGLAAASRHYFGKPPQALDLSEAAALVSLPRGPSLYDPERRPQLLERRRLRVLERMAGLGFITPAELSRAELTPLLLQLSRKPQGSEHLSFALARRYAGAGEKTRVIRSALSAQLQEQAERIARDALPRLDAHGGSAISAVVLDNATGDVLAYVGSPGYFAAEKLGANDGVRAKRQPGSALKPFVYAAAMQRLGYGPATLLPDLPRAFDMPGGSFNPRNYDQQFRGPVLLRQALASSLNLPALEVASRVGPPRLLELLQRFGFASLSRDAAHYGVALALGDGEVTLLELTQAYAALARGGELVPARLVLGTSRAGAGEQRVDSAPALRVLQPEVAALVTDMLADDAARVAGFGRDSVLKLPFPVAAKTGTSKGFRDNWAVGYTQEVTVGVWVGNFDGAPLRDASGITVAGPVFHELMRAAMAGREPAPLVSRAGLMEAEVCTLSGELPSELCPHRRRESFVRGQAPSATCSIHAAAHVDGAGRQVAARCGGSTRVLERYPVEFRAWAVAAGRPLWGHSLSSTCPPEPDAGELRVVFPREGQRFLLDPDAPDRQEIVVSAAASAARARLVIDGQPAGERSAPFTWTWALTPGWHTIWVEAAGGKSAAVRFQVSAPGVP